ncbi:MAG: hypothetical protein Q9157_002022 [Trypethelium eluteriae]
MAINIDPVGLAIFLGEVTKLIHEAVERYTGANRELALIEAQLAIFQTHIEIISKWLESSPSGASRPTSIVENVQKALSLIQDAIWQLHGDLHRVYSSPTSKVGNLVTTAIGFGRAVKAKYVLNEQLLRGHLIHLRECGAVLGMALQATQLHSQDETNERLQDVCASANLVRRKTKKSERQQLRNNRDSTLAFREFLDFLDTNESELDWTHNTVARPSDSTPAMEQQSVGTGLVPERRSASFPRPRENPPPYQELPPTSFSRDLSTHSQDINATDVVPDTCGLQSSTAGTICRNETVLGSSTVPVLRSQKSMPLRRKPVAARQESGSSTATVNTLAGSTFSTPSSIYRFQSPDSLFQAVTKEKSYAHRCQSPSSLSDNGIEKSMEILQGTGTAPFASRQMRPAFKAEHTPGTPRTLPLRSPDSSLSEGNSGLSRLRKKPSRDRDGLMALHQAVCDDNPALVIQLVEQGANVHARDSRERTPLHHAATFSAPISKYLITQGTLVDSRDIDTKTPLLLAAEAEQDDVVELILCREKSNGNPNYDMWKLSIFVAIEKGHIRLAQRFIDAGFSLKKLRKDSHKPAQLAAKSGSLPMLDFIIEHKASVKDKDKDERGFTPLHTAALYGHSVLIQRLTEKGGSPKATNAENETPLHLAVRSGDFTTLEAVLKLKNVSLKEKDKRDQEAIHLATRLGHIAMFNNLVASGAKVTNENSFGWKPIHIASAYGHAVLLQQLLAEDEVSTEEKLGTSSVKRSETSVLVEQGFYAEAHWPYPGSRPLHLAAEFGKTDVANLLIELGAKLEATCSAGWRPLHHAAFNGDAELVQKLLNAGASPDSRTNQNKTALELGFRTNGELISDHDKLTIQSALQMAMPIKGGNRSFVEYRNALRIKPCTVEDKERAILAVAQAKSVLSSREKQTMMTVGPQPKDWDTG